MVLGPAVGLDSQDSGRSYRTLQLAGVAKITCLERLDPLGESGGPLSSPPLNALPFTLQIHALPARKMEILALNLSTGYSANHQVVCVCICVIASM